MIKRHARFVALILSVLMVVSQFSVVSFAADEIVNTEQPVTVEETQDEAQPEEAAASVAETAGAAAEETAQEIPVKEEPVAPAPVKKAAKKADTKASFNKSKTVDGVKVTVKAGKGVFPKGSKLSVKKVSVPAAVDTENAAETYAFDISIISGGKKIQPDGKAKVSFTTEEVADKSLETAVYHMDGKTPEELKVTESGETATVTTTGFSIFVVNFYAFAKDYDDDYVGSCAIEFYNGQTKEITDVLRQCDVIEQDDYVTFARVDKGVNIVNVDLEKDIYYLTANGIGTAEISGTYYNENYNKEYDFYLAVEVQEHEHAWVANVANGDSSKVYIYCSKEGCEYNSNRITFTLEADSSAVYNGKPQKAGAVITNDAEIFPTGLEVGTIKYFDKKRGENDEWWTDGAKSIGSHTIAVAIKYNKNDVIRPTRTFEITPVEVTDPVAAENLVYNGEKQPLLSSAGTTNSGVLKYVVYDSSGRQLTEFSEEIPKWDSAGLYRVYYRPFNDEGAWISDDPDYVEVEIAKADPTATVTPKKDLVFNAKNHYLLDMELTGSSDGRLECKIGSDGTYMAPEKIKEMNAGDYEVYYRVVGDSNHNYKEFTEPVIATIAPTKLKITNKPTANKNLVYNGDEQLLIASDGTVKATNRDDDPQFMLKYKLGSAGIYDSSGTIKATAAGNHTIYYSVFTPSGKEITPDNKNYEIRDSKGKPIWDNEQSLIAHIGRATLRITAEDYTGVYDGNDHSIEVSSPSSAGVMAVDSGSVAILYKEDSAAVSDWSTEKPFYRNAGSYTVNYKLELSDGIKGNYKLPKKSDKYEGSANVEITKRPVDVEWHVLTRNPKQGEPSDEKVNSSGYYIKEYSNEKFTMQGIPAKSTGTDSSGVIPKDESNFKLEGTVTFFDYVGHSLLESDAVTDWTIKGYDCTDVNLYVGAAKVGETYSNNYEVTDETYNMLLAIHPKDVTIDWGNTEFTANGKHQAPTPTISDGIIAGDECTIPSEGVVVGFMKDGSFVKQTVTKEPGEYVARVTELSNRNYSYGSTYPSTNYVINKGTAPTPGGGGSVTDPVDEVVKMLKALDPNSATYADDAKKAVDAYNALTEAQQNDDRFKEQEVASKLAGAEAEVQSEADKKAAEPVIKQIEALNENSTKAEVEAARAAFNALTPAQQAACGTAIFKLQGEEYRIYSTEAKAKKVADFKVKNVKVSKKAKTRKVKATWTATEGVDGYQLYYKAKKAKKAKYVTISNPETVKKTVKNLKKNKKYTFKIRTFNVVYNPITSDNEKVYGKWAKKSITTKK